MIYFWWKQNGTEDEIEWATFPMLSNNPCNAISATLDGTFGPQMFLLVCLSTRVHALYRM